jgi:hypothetical protein
MFVTRFCLRSEQFFLIQNCRRILAVILSSLVFLAPMSLNVSASGLVGARLDPIMGGDTSQGEQQNQAASEQKMATSQDAHSESFIIEMTNGVTSCRVAKRRSGS